MATVLITPITLSRLKDTYGEKKAAKLWTKVQSKRSNATQRGIQIGFGMEDVKLFAEPWLGNGLCDYTGEPLSDDPTSPMKASLERIDDTKGYMRGNLCVVGSRVNALKDALWDKQTNTTISADSAKLVRLIMENISTDRLEELKKKYNPHYHKELFVEEDMCINLQIDPTKQSGYVQPVAEAIAEPAPAEPEFELPLDVQIAAGYAQMCKFLHKAGREVTITFSQFKTAHQAKKCVITGKELGDDRIPMLMNPEGIVEPGNVKFAEPNACAKMNELMAVTGMNMYDLAKQMRKLVV